MYNKVVVVYVIMVLLNVRLEEVGKILMLVLEVKLAAAVLLLLRFNDEVGLAVVIGPIPVERPFEYALLLIIG